MSDDRYFQGISDGIAIGVNLSEQELGFLAPAPNLTTQPEFIHGEMSIDVAFIDQRAIPPTPVSGPTAHIGQRAILPTPLGGPADHIEQRAVPPIPLSRPVIHNVGLVPAPRFACNFMD